MDLNNFDGGSNQMIRNQMQLSEDIQLVSQRLEVLETQIQTLITGQQSIIWTINKTTKKDKKRPEHKTSKQKVKLPRQTNQQPSASDVSKLLHLPEALQRNIQRFTEDILFTSSNLRDDLISAECLSEDECSYISARQNPKDQIRLLIRKIKSRGPEVIEKFLDTLGEDHPELRTEVYKTLDEILNECKDKPICAICLMQCTVDLKNIADYLWSQKIISDNTFGDIFESESLYTSRSLIWSDILTSLNNFTNAEDAKDILLNALRPKYEHIVKYINQISERSFLSCCCHRKNRRVRQRPLVADFGSQTDVSTTSARLPKFLDDDIYSDDDQSVRSSQGLSSYDLLSYELPERFENMSGISVQQAEIQNSVIDSATTITDDFTTRAKNNARQISASLAQFEIYGNQDTHSQDKTLEHLKESLSDIAQANVNDRQELKHSFSTISNASTVCAINSVSTDEFRSLNESELNNNAKTSDVREETDQAFFPKSTYELADENESIIVIKANGDNQKEIQVSADDHGDKDDTKVKNPENHSTKAKYTTSKSYRNKRSINQHDAEVTTDGNDDDNQVSSTTSYHAVFEQGKSAEGLTNILQEAEEVATAKEDNEISSTSYEAYDTKEMNNQKKQ